MANSVAAQKKSSIDSKRVKEFFLKNGIYIALIAMIVLVIFIRPKFATLSTLSNILAQSSTRLIFALGVAPTIILLGTDLSLGRIVGLCAVISASLLQSASAPDPFYEGLGPVFILIPWVLVMVVGGLFGALNGFGVAFLKMHAFVVTLGTQLIAYGAASLYFDKPGRGATPIGSLDEGYTGLCGGSITILDGGTYWGKLSIPFIFIIAVAVTVLIWILWNKTRLGKNMYAVGGNPEAAAVSGVSYNKTIMFFFTLAGVLYGFAALMEAGRVGSATNNMGLNYELDAISAAVVGGVSFAGGVGKVSGVVFGVFIFQFLNYGLQFVGISPYIQNIVKGPLPAAM